MTTKVGGGNWLIASSIKSRPRTNELDRDAFFEVAYSHFAEAGVWELYPDVIEVLEALAAAFRSRGRLKLRRPPAHDPGATRRLAVFLARVPLQRTRRRQTRSVDLPARAEAEPASSPAKTLHVGDDPVRDWQGAAAAGLSVFRLERPRNSLRDLLRLRSGGLLTADRRIRQLARPPCNLAATDEVD